MESYQSEAEVSVRELRATLAKILNDVTARQRTVYITSHGRRTAAIVPVAAADQIQQRKDQP